MKGERHLAAFVVGAFLTIAPWAPNAAASRSPFAITQEPNAPGDAEQAMFTKGQKLYLQGNYTQAAEVLENFLTTYPNSIITDLTLLWLGRSYYQVGKFSQAEEIGKRLRAIKGTPFAEIYDNELETARRKATAQPPVSGDRETAASQVPAQTSSTVAPVAARNRYAKANAATSTLTLKRNVAGPASRPATESASRAKLHKRSDHEISRLPVRSSSTKAKRPSSANTRTVRAGNTASPYREVPARTEVARPSKRAGPTSRQPMFSATSIRNPPKQRQIATQPAAPSAARALRTGRTTAGSIGWAGSISRPASRRSNATPKQSSAFKKSSPRPIHRAPTDRAAAPVPARNKQPQVMSSRADSPGSGQAPAVQRVATGGLYSMIETAGAIAPVGPVPDTRVEAMSKQLMARPGDKVYLSFVVRNFSTTKQTYELRVTAPGAPEATMYVDSNGDGKHESDELRVTGSPVIEMKNSEIPFLLEVTVPLDAFEGQRYSYTMLVVSFGSGEVIAKATATLVVSSIRASSIPAQVSGDNAALRPGIVSLDDSRSRVA